MSRVQEIDYLAIAAPLLVALLGLGVLVLDAFLPPARRAVAGWVTAAGLAVAGGLLLPLVGERRATFCLPGDGGLPACSYVVDDLTLVFQALVVGGALVCVLLSLDTVRDSALPAGEYFFLLLASVAGALTLAASRDLLTLVVALEVVSLPAFALVALRRFDSRSSEAALKLFLVSVVSTAVMLFGLSLVYGLTGEVHLSRIAAALAAPSASEPAIVLAVTLALAGFGFKVAAVPFHFWAPDTYQGAPVPVAAYLSVVSKAAGFVGLALLLTEGFAPYADRWSPAVAVVAALTMTVGNLAALRQTHAVRLLAWSSVAQSGYMLVPLGSAAGGDLGAVLPATIAYVLAYAVMNLGAFSVVTLVGRHRPANLLEDYRGLGRTEPLSAFALAFSLACLAGLPPGLLGLFAKVVVFRAPVDQGVGWLAVVMALNVVVGLYYYLTWATALYARAPDAAGTGRPPSYRISWSDGLAIGATLGAALLFSLAPDPLLSFPPTLR
ncbi:MAG TPA: NADH-quinone oxidoreductase subunit N [Acidimicrobiales bacterium]|nr:NADH-quinone oxidoreductase subunit N [Acidimicrobiales bacterium]